MELVFLMDSKNSPVILVSSAHSGGRRLQQILGCKADMAYTTATGIITLCQTADTTWRRVEGGVEGATSTLAGKAIRTHALVLVSTILARSGKKRWCELITAPPASADTFLRLFPETRFICVHRAFDDVAHAVAEAHPWDLSSSEIGAFTNIYPGNRLSAIAAYWASYSEQLVTLEEAHKHASLRVLYEDLVADQANTLDRVLEFLGIDGLSGTAEPPWNAVRHMAEAREARFETRAGLPFGDIPDELVNRVNRMLARLGYPALHGAG
jgi:hypothetical protein